MKGTFFLKPIEYRLEVDGETWKQGDSLKGTLIVKNHGSAPVPAGAPGVRIAVGGLKKVHEKVAGAFDVLAAALLDSPAAVEPGAEGRFDWSLSTGVDAPITDATRSPFLLYGQGEDPAQLGHLQLVFLPHPLIQDFLRELQTQFRFVQKTQRYAKTKGGWVETKLAPPSGRAFSSLEHLMLGLRLNGEELQVNYVFHVKKLEATAATIQSTKATREYEQSFSPSDYRLPSGRFNPERIEAGIAEAIKEFDSKILS